MLAILHSLGLFVLDLFKSRCRLEAENLFLRHQLNIALRQAPPRLRLCGSDRTLLVWMTRLWPSVPGVAKVVQPETILRWHRAGFRAFWRWKSRNRAGRPKIDRGLRDLIQRMSKENPQWGASSVTIGAAQLENTGRAESDELLSVTNLNYFNGPQQPTILGHAIKISRRGNGCNTFATFGRKSLKYR